MPTRTESYADNAVRVVSEEIPYVGVSETERKAAINNALTHTLFLVASQINAVTTLNLIGKIPLIPSPAEPRINNGDLVYDRAVMAFADAFNDASQLALRDEIYQELDQNPEFEVGDQVAYTGQCFHFDYGGLVTDVDKEKRCISVYFRDGHPAGGNNKFIHQYALERNALEAEAKRNGIYVKLAFQLGGLLATKLKEKNLI